MSRVITFYSYKGGTGRSMALANVAWILACAGKRVLAIDWDLEAPGLHRYFHPFLRDKELSGQESQGVIDMAIDFAVRAATPLKIGEGADDKWYLPYADFSKWRQRLRWPSGEEIRLGPEGKGEIDFVPAGRQDDDYAIRVNHFDWHSFYERLGGGAFFDEAKRKFDAYDYVLIDSRTGVSDTSGICTVQMPDTLVVCFTLNYQSIKGAFAVAQSVKAQRPAIRILPVPTRIDGSEAALLSRMKNYASNVFTEVLDAAINPREYWYSMEVPYFARYAYEEKLALFEEQSSISSSMLPSMERLTDYLTNGLVRSTGPLPSNERAAALALFGGTAEIEPSDRKSAARLERPAPVNLTITREKLSGYAPASVFLSYRPQSRAFAEVIYQILLQLGETVFDRIKVFMDSHSIVSGDSFIEATKEALDRSDFLLVLGAALDRQVFSGYEVGYFSASNREQVGRGRDTGRRIVFISFGVPAHFNVDPSAHYINISFDGLNSLTPSDDSMARLAELLEEIAKRAESRLPPSLNDDPSALERVRGRRGKVINDQILPFARSQLSKVIGDQVYSEVLQTSVEFDLPAPAVGEIYRAIPDGATLQGMALEIFGLGKRMMTWREFCDVELARSLTASRSIAELERAVVDAAWSSNVQEEDIVIYIQNTPYQMVITSLRTYFNGRKRLQVHFSRIAAKGVADDGPISILLGVVTVASKYVVLLQRDSPYSAETFIFMRDMTTLQDKVRHLTREFGWIEEQAARLGLEEPSAAAMYYVDGNENLIAWESVQKRWGDARLRVGRAAQAILTASADSHDFFNLRGEWVKALEAFRQETSALSAIVIRPALANLDKRFRELAPKQDNAVRG